MTEALDRQTQQWIGLVFLAGMVLTLVLAVWTFDGTPTIVLLVVALVFLVVSRFFLAGDVSEPTANQAHASPANGQAARPTHSGPVYVVCPGCQERVPETDAFCSSCGHELEG